MMAARELCGRRVAAGSFYTVVGVVAVAGQGPASRKKAVRVAQRGRRGGRAWATRAWRSCVDRMKGGKGWKEIVTETETERIARRGVLTPSSIRYTSTAHSQPNRSSP